MRPLSWLNACSYDQWASRVTRYGHWLSLVCFHGSDCAADTVSSKLVDRLSYHKPENPNKEILRDVSWHPFQPSIVTAGMPPDFLTNQQQAAVPNRTQHPTSN